MNNFSLQSRLFSIIIRILHRIYHKKCPIDFLDIFTPANSITRNGLILPHVYANIYKNSFNFLFREFLLYFYKHYTIELFELSFITFKKSVVSFKFRSLFNNTWFLFSYITHILLDHVYFFICIHTYIYTRVTCLKKCFYTYHDFT